MKKIMKLLELFYSTIILPVTALGFIFSFVYILIALFLNITGEKVKTEVEGKIYACVDTRDNEHFSFNSKTSEEIDDGIKIVDTNGVTRKLFSDTHLVIKCKEVNSTSGETIAVF